MNKRTKSFLPRQFSGFSSSVRMDEAIGRDRNGKEITAMDFLQSDKLFRNMKKGAVKKLAKCLQVLKFKKGEVIVRKGDKSDSLYIIAFGVVEFSDERDGQNVTLRKFAAGEMFGEFGMVNGSPRTLTATAYTDTVAVLILKKEVFEANREKVFMEPIEERVAKINQTMMAGGLTQIDFLKDIPAERIVEIGNLFKYEYHEEGHTLFHEGDAGDRFYLIYSGSLVLTIKDDMGFPVELARLTAGTTFGERSLLQDTQRSATITTMEDSELFSLGRHQFKQFRYFLPEINQQLTERLSQASVSKLVPIFQSLTIKQKMNLDSISQKRVFKPGETILTQGEDKNYGLYVITEGVVDVFVDGDKVRTLETGSYFGEVSLVSQKVHGHTATISVPPKGIECTCLKIGKRDFRNLLRESPAVEVEMQIKVLGDKVGLDQLLLHPLGRASFLEHCENEFATENVEFWQEVSALENLGERKVARSVLVALGADIDGIKQMKREILENKANGIFKRYILPNAPAEVNIPADMRDAVIKRVKEFDYSYDMFAEAKEEIFRLIQADNFTRYKKSPQFQSVLEEIGQYDK